MLHHYGPMFLVRPINQRGHSVIKSFDDLFPMMLRAGMGDQETFELLYRKYAHDLKLVIRAHLRDRVRRHSDPEDVLDSVWRAMLGDVWDNKTFTTKAGFRAFLIRYAEHKTADLNRKYHSTQKRDVSRVIPMNEDVPQRGTSVEQALENRDSCDFLMQTSPEEERDVYVHLMKGDTKADIMRKLSITEYRLTTVLANARQRLSAAQHD